MLSMRKRACRDVSKVAVTPKTKKSAAENIEKQWREVRRHATVVRDPEKLEWLRHELERRKHGAEASYKRIL